MEWYYAFLLIFGALMVLMAVGLPVAFSFFVVILGASMYFIGPETGPYRLVLSFYSTLAHFTIAPLPMFILMGAAMFHSGVGMTAIDGMAKWLGKVPGRLSILALAGGTLMSMLSGVAMATTAMLGSLLLPEMRRRGYSKPMSIGPIIGSGGLAIIIPPSALVVIYATIAEISVGKLLIAGVIPGLLMATLYLAQIIIRVKLNPSLAPAYEVSLPSLKEKLRALFVDILPLGFIIFLVLGLIFLGVATPTESASVGAIGTLLLTMCYRKFSWGMLVRSIADTVKVSVMALLIIGGSVAFSQILGLTGVNRGIVGIIQHLNWPPYSLLFMMMLMVLSLGTFMDQISIMMITIPIFTPILLLLGFDPVWFGILMLINLEIALTTPPFGLLLFVMKGVAPEDTTMWDIYRAGFPFLLCDLVALTLVTAFPNLALWLPVLMI